MIHATKFLLLREFSLLDVFADGIGIFLAVCALAFYEKFIQKKWILYSFLRIKYTNKL